MKNQELIEKYFSNSLSPEELKKLNELVKEDSAFEEEFSFQKDLKTAIAQNQRESVKEIFKEIELKHQKHNTFKFNKWLVAASISILIAIGIFSYNNYIKSNEYLYAEYFQPYRNVIEPVERGEQERSIENSAFEAYESKKYHKAINLFNSVEDSQRECILFYKAISYLEINKPEQAIELLNPLVQNNLNEEEISNLVQKATWYLGLSYLKIGDSKNAIEQFSILSNGNENTYKQEEAIKILEKIN